MTFVLGGHTPSRLHALDHQLQIASARFRKCDFQSGSRVGTVLWIDYTQRARPKVWDILRHDELDDNALMLTDRSSISSGEGCQLEGTIGRDIPGRLNALELERFRLDLPNLNRTAILKDDRSARWNNLRAFGTSGGVNQSNDRNRCEQRFHEIERLSGYSE